MGAIGRALIGFGLLLIAIGAVLVVSERLRLPVGRLPGDLAYRGKNVSVYFPIATCLVLSALLSLAIYLINRFRG